jgi:transposase
MLEVSPGAVVLWRTQYERKGDEGLAAKPQRGRPPKLSPARRKRLLGLLKKGPQAHGYTTDLWTLPRVAEVIHKRFGVRYDPSHVWRILTALGWSAQKPEQRARERDEQAIERWRREDWPRIKKARRTGRSLVLSDESGFLLQPVVRRTWAPRGQTPI